MSIFPGGEGPLMGRGPHAEHTALEVYGHVEELCREEVELLQIAEEKRAPHQHRRLHQISAELDRVGERLRERAHRLGRG